ncbi:MAG: hypothetical protein PHX38_09690 [Sulfuricella sp.]|nr:hypothetical protein [Sulfuricella sp.]
MMTGAAARALLCALAVAAAAPAGAICTPATINPGAMQAIRPHMSPAAVSAILGYPPTNITVTETGTNIWIFGVPYPLAMARALEYEEVGVAFDAAGALFAIYTTAPLITRRPAGNGALRVDPGGWIPGAFSAQ